MIHINLLPDEYRKAERTSPKLFATVLLAVVAVCSAFGWFGFVYFGDLGKLEVEHAAVQEELKGMADQVTYHDRLLKERQDYQQRAKTIEQIGQSRIVWSRILDELIDLVNSGVETNRHQAWLASLAVSEGRGNEGPKLTIPGWVAGESFRVLADFNEDLRAAPFARFAKSISDPSGNLAYDAERKPSAYIKFPMSFEFRPAKEWKKLAKDAAPAAPAGR